MGVLASHVPAIEQLKPGVVEVIEESSGSKSFFREYSAINATAFWITKKSEEIQVARANGLSCSFWWLCCRPAWFQAQHQRSRRFPPGGLQRRGMSFLGM